jgi:putative endonuclease
MYYVYLIQSLVDNSYYVGMTSDLERRLKEHNNGKTKSIKHKVPFKLVYYEAYLDKTIARKREIQLKKSWQTKKEIIYRISNN